MACRDFSLIVSCWFALRVLRIYFFVQMNRGFGLGFKFDCLPQTLTLKPMTLCICAKW